MTFKPNKNLTESIIRVMTIVPATRDNDRGLINAYYEEIFPEEFTKTGEMKPKALLRMTNPDEIVRARAYIQNDMGLLLPRKEKIRAIRKRTKEQWEQWKIISRSARKINEVIWKHLYAK